jgi:hypothetical protein
MMRVDDPQASAPTPDAGSKGLDVARRAEVANIRAAFAAARLAVDQAEQQALAALNVPAGDLAQPTAPIGVIQPDWGTMGKAAEIGKCSIETMTKHVIENGMGVKPEGAQWRVDLVRVRAWRAGKRFERLIPYPDRPTR